MRTAERKIERIYTPLFWSASADMLGTQLEQSFKQDEGGDAAYVPNRRLTPTVIVPVIRTRDADGIFRTGAANDLLADMHWYDGDKEITFGADYSMDTGNTLRRGALTIHRNTPAGTSLQLRFEAVIPDNRRKENVKVFLDGIQSGTTDVATDKYEVTADIAPSYLYDPLTDADTLVVNASAFRSTKGATTLLSYELRKIVGGVERPLDASDYEVTSSASPRFVFNPKLIESNQYALIGRLAGVEVGRYLFSITRGYPAWEAKQAGAADMEAGQMRVADSVTVTATGHGTVNRQDAHFSIQPHTVTRKNGDMNWGERSVIEVSAMDTGFEEGGEIGIYFDVNQLPCNKVALSESGNVLTDENNKLLIL